MSNETSSPVVAGHTFCPATDRCTKCSRHRFYCAGDLDYGCCVGLSNLYEREQLQRIQEACWKAVEAIAPSRGMGSIKETIWE